RTAAGGVRGRGPAHRARLASRAVAPLAPRRALRRRRPFRAPAAHGPAPRLAARKRRAKRRGPRLAQSKDGPWAFPGFRHSRNRVDDRQWRRMKPLRRAFTALERRPWPLAIFAGLGFTLFVA